MQTWFVLKSGTVVGPITSDKVLSQYNSQNVLVWGLACSDWMSFQDWSQQLNQGAFDIEVPVSRTPIKPDLKKANEPSKVFKIKPVSGMSLPEDEKTQVESEPSFVSSNYGEEKKPSHEEFEKTAVASLPDIPDVADEITDELSIEASNEISAEMQEAHDKEVSDVLNDQLNNILQQPDIDDDGHTLVQATMDDLTHEMGLNPVDHTQVQNLDLGDGPTKVQSADDLSLELGDGATKVQSADELSLDDGATKVQSADSFSLNLDDGATKVQGPGDLSLDLDDGATKIQGPGDLNLNLDDGATKVQSADDLSLDLGDGATKVQSADDLNLDAGNLDSDDGATKVQSADAYSLDIDPNASQTEVDTFNIEYDSNSHAEIVEPATEVQASDFFKMEDVAQDTDVADADSSPGEFTLDQVAVEEVAPEGENQDSADLNLGEFFNAENVIEVVSEKSDETHQVAQPDVSVESHVDDDAKAKTVLDLNEKTNVAELKEAALSLEQSKALEKPVWYAAYDGESEGPMNVETLLKKLDNYENPEFVYLWKKGFKDWQNLYDTPQISSQLGIGFRRHDRFPFTGTVKIEFNGNIQIGQLENLSLSGLGATGFGPLVLGEVVKVTLDCAELESEIEFVAEIRFTSDQGVLGLAFIKTEYVENVNKVIELVKSVGQQEAA